MEKLLDQYKPISLEEMGDIKLMNRIDTKFVTTVPKLRLLLTMARQDYRVQEVNGSRNLPYHTVYYDTPYYDMFYRHQTGHTNRQKVRVREYESSNLQFLELKTKNNHGRTKKKRIRIFSSDLVHTDMHDAEKVAFLKERLQYDPLQLVPAMDNHFNRITLVNNKKTERLTIDTDMFFHNVKTAHNWHEEQLVIIELKRDGLCFSPILGMLSQLRVFPHGFSKYCIGSAMTNDALRINRFKVKLRDVQKIINTTI